MGNRRHLSILGVRGIPAAHGGFETFAENLALYLVAGGWDVTVFCQGADREFVDHWRGVRRHHLRSGNGSAGSVVADFRATRIASRRDGLNLVLGYNTALFNLALNLRRRPYVMNMDGIEWQRRKWNRFWKVWFWLNERLACKAATALIADHPEIARHLALRRPRGPIATIPYGAHPTDPLGEADTPDDSPSGSPYALVVARPEPENSILEMVQAWSLKPRHAELRVLGSYSTEEPYQASVLRAASDEVRFLGPVYDRQVLQRLRSGCAFYMYGHTVGGTSPTLVEALGAKSPILALDTVYSRWVAGSAAVYFSDVSDCGSAIEWLLSSPHDRAVLSKSAAERFVADFTWPHVLATYEAFLEDWI